jgi:hypothetical protein
VWPVKKYILIFWPALIIHQELVSDRLAQLCVSHKELVSDLLANSVFRQELFSDLLASFMSL